MIMIELTSPYVHYYHRGVNKERIFFSENNYEYLKNILLRHLQDYHVELLAFCLMPNHYHILLKHEKEIEGSRYIQRVFNTYVQAVNKQMERVGTLFQGSVKRRNVESEEYLMETIRYIHVNPVSAGMVNRPEEWGHSDYKEWIELSKPSRNLLDECQLIFGGSRNYKEFVELAIEKKIYN